MGDGQAVFSHRSSHVYKAESGVFFCHFVEFLIHQGNMFWIQARDTHREDGGEQDAAAVTAAQGVKGLYTHSLFHFGPEHRWFLDSGLELGRSFVHNPKKVAWTIFGTA